MRTNSNIYHQLQLDVAISFQLHMDALDGEKAELGEADL
jgi:hypothetical protein